MKKLLCLLPLAFLLGCPSATTTTPPTALAPGYSSPADQQFGQALAAAHAFALQATADYGKLTPTQQAAEKDALNGFIAAVNAADTVYSDFHRGLVAASDVQAQLAKVSTAQAAYAAVSTGGK